MFDEAREIKAIIESEGGWRDAPPDPPTMRGISLPLWDEWCRATGQTFRTGKRALRASTETDAHNFFRWYFHTKGIAELITEFNLPHELTALVMDLRTQHSFEGCQQIFRFAEEVRDPQTAVITLSRIRYVMQLAYGPQPHLKKDIRGLVARTLSAIGWWPASSPHTKVNV